MQERLTVSQLTRYIKRVFSFDNVLSNVCVTGEISNFKLHSSGHMYFTLKDDIKNDDNAKGEEGVKDE